MLCVCALARIFFFEVIQSNGKKGEERTRKGGKGAYEYEMEAHS